MRHFIFFLLLSISTTLLHSQKFGKVEKDVVAALSHSDSSAHAAYLFKNCDIKFLFLPNKIFLKEDHHELIKIYDEAGESYADFSIPLYSQNSDEETITRIKAKTYNLENGKVVETDLSRKKDIFEEKTSDNWRQIKFAMPNVKPGSVVEISYTKQSPFIYQLDRWYFQSEIPVDFSRYSVTNPKYYVYTPIPSGFIPITTHQKELSGSKHGEVKHTFLAENVAPLKEDEYVLNINDYKSSLKYELYSVQYPNSPIDNYSKSWVEIGNNLLKSSSFGKLLKQKLKGLEPAVAKAKTLADKEKIQYIYDYVRTEYSWNENYGIYDDVGIKKLLANKSGNIGDINCLLINLLNKSGVGALPVVSKSRNRGLLNDKYPTLTELNYLMAYVPVGNEYMLLDATSKSIPMGQLPIRATNMNGILIKEDLSKVIDIDNPNVYKTQTLSKYTIDTDLDELVGIVKRKKSKYSAVRHRMNIENKDEAEENNDGDHTNDDNEEEDDILFKNEAILVGVENIDDLYKDINLEYEETIREQIKKIGDSYFIDAAIDFGVGKNPFTEEDRDFPVFFNYKIDTKSIVSIEIPEGYEIETVPDPISAATPNKKARFSYSAKQLSNTLTINYILSVNDDLFLHSDYPALKKLYDLIVNKEQEKIVLVKKT